MTIVVTMMIELTTPWSPEQLEANLKAAGFLTTMKAGFQAMNLGKVQEIWVELTGDQSPYMFKVDAHLLKAPTIPEIEAVLDRTKFFPMVERGFAGIHKDLAGKVLWNSVKERVN